MNINQRAEEIVKLIGNIANREDVRVVQAKQTTRILDLVEDARRETLEGCGLTEISLSDAKTLFEAAPDKEECILNLRIYVTKEYRKEHYERENSKRLTATSEDDGGEVQNLS